MRVSSKFTSLHMFPLLVLVVRNSKLCIKRVKGIKTRLKRTFSPYHAIITPLSVQNLLGGQSNCNPVASVTILRVSLMYSLLATPPDTTCRGQILGVNELIEKTRMPLRNPGAWWSYQSRVVLG